MVPVPGFHGTVYLSVLANSCSLVLGSSGCINCLINDWTHSRVCSRSRRPALMAHIIRVKWGL